MVNMVYKAWQYHFNLLNLAYLYFLTFSDNMKKLFPGISDSTIGKMVAGVEAYMFKPQEELAFLARLAFGEPRVKEILMKDIPAEEKIKELKKIPEGEVWLQKLEEAKDPWFYVNCGSGWYHYEGSWKDKLDLPFSYLKGYLERLERGETIERLMAHIQKEREELFQQYKALVPTEEDRESLEKLYRDSLTLYRFSEGHIFWVEHWFHTIWFDKVRELGAVLVKAKVLKEVDDIFMFNRLEIPTLIEDAVTAWALGEGVPTRDWASKAKRRRGILEAAKKWSPSPALGVAPEVIAEPFTVMLWGVTTEKAEEWLKGLSVDREKVEEIKGFPASKGVAEGPARVIKSLEELEQLQEGEILVCPSTNPSWAPVFARIKAAVTDIGGVTCHAAIVAREFGLPSVTGTGIATQVIRTGDIIRVDGDNGVVRIIKRAS
jgi:pyruvate,water dikinase